MFLCYSFKIECLDGKGVRDGSEIEIVENKWIVNDIFSGEMKIWGLRWFVYMVRFVVDDKFGWRCVFIGRDVFRVVGREDIEFMLNFGKVIVGVVLNIWWIISIRKLFEWRSIYLFLFLFFLLIEYVWVVVVFKLFFCWGVWIFFLELVVIFLYVFLEYILLVWGCLVLEI